MKRFVRLIFAFALLICLSSCSSYYYSFLSSNDMIGEKNDKYEFTQENDTLRVTYNFYGENAPVHITLYNKLPDTLYVDWAHSALVIDNESTSYAPEYYEGSVQMIPPYSKLDNTPIHLSDFIFDQIPRDKFEVEEYTKFNGDTIKLPSMLFSEENSPLRFRSYISIFPELKNDDAPSYRVFERSFYVSKLISAGKTKPSDFEPAMTHDGDFFYTSNHRSERTAIVIGAIAISAAGLFIDVAASPDSYQ